MFLRCSLDGAVSLQGILVKEDTQMKLTLKTIQPNSFSLTHVAKFLF